MCPCHGSQYDAQGKKIRGPAPLVRAGALEGAGAGLVGVEGQMLCCSRHAPLSQPLVLHLMRKDEGRWRQRLPFTGGAIQQGN